MGCCGGKEEAKYVFQKKKKKKKKRPTTTSTKPVGKKPEEKPEEKVENPPAGETKKEEEEKPQKVESEEIDARTESVDAEAASPASKATVPSKTFPPKGGVKDGIWECIGDTPMVWLKKSLPEDCKARICVKLESENPANSVKDRLGLAMIDSAERNGFITPGKSTLVEATSGNTGIALAMLGAAKGYHVVLTMPAYGAEVVLTPASKGVKGAQVMAEKICKERENAVLTKQFETAVNAQVHEDTTGPEIWKAVDGEMACLVSGVGTGGTITGCARYLKSQGSGCKIIAVEPEESPVLSGGNPGPHKIQGIGAGFKPAVLDMDLVDEVLTVSSEKSIARARCMPTTEGLLVGISAGAIIDAAIALGTRPEYAEKVIVAIVPSYGERYLSTVLFSEIVEECKALPVCTEEECSPAPEAVPEPSKEEAPVEEAPKEEAKEEDKKEEEKKEEEVKEADK